MVDINELRQSLGAVQPEEVAVLLDRLEAAEEERDTLRARIEEMERQEPVAFALYSGWARKAVYLSEIEACEQRDRRQLTADLGGSLEAYRVVPLCLAPGAQPAPSIPEGWLRAIDEALVVAHIGVANESDTYEQAKAKLNSLICFHVDVATDPAINGGYKLVPIEPAPGMMRGTHRLVAAARRVLASADSQGLIRLDESGDVASELRSALAAVKSETAQRVANKSVEAVERWLDSVAPEEKK